jgi:hypothetical protein
MLVNTQKSCFDVPQQAYHLSWEQEQYVKRMTLQVCFIGSDGIVLASDTRCVQAGPGVITSTSSSPKITVDPTSRFAWCGAGGPIIGQTCAIIGEQIKDSRFAIDPIPALREIGQSAKDDDRNRSSGTNNRVLFASAVAKSVWLLDMTLDHIEVHPKYGKCTIGAEGNAAIFFYEQYFPRDPIPVDRLPLLAAHIVLMGAGREPQFVNGLEITLSKGRAFRRLADDELAVLRSKSEHVSNSIRRELVLSSA